MRTVLILFLICLLPVASRGEEAARLIPDRRVAVTFDDLPAQRGSLQIMQDVTERLLAKITAEEIPAVGFVNEGKLYRLGEVDERTELLRMWLAAGLELGNHTFSHNCDLDSMTPEEYKEDVIRGETVIRMLLEEEGMKLRYFRHPCLYTGPTPEYKRELDEFLVGRGYTTAPVTIDNSEWMFDVIYSRAKKNGDTALVRRVAETYVPYMETMFEFCEKLSAEYLDYEIPQVLLLHANEINADYFDGLVGMMKGRGYRFITLEEALQDSAYSLPEAHSKYGISWIHRWRKAAGLEFRPEPDPPQFITDLYKGGYR